MRVEIKDVDPRDMESFLNDMLRIITSGNGIGGSFERRFASATEQALEKCGSPLRCFETNNAIYITKGE